MSSEGGLGPNVCLRYLSFFISYFGGGHGLQLTTWMLLQKHFDKKNKSLRSIDNVWNKVCCTQSFLYIPFSFFFPNTFGCIPNTFGCKLIFLQSEKEARLEQFPTRNSWKEVANQNSKSHILRLNFKLEK